MEIPSAGFWMKMVTFRRFSKPKVNLFQNETDFSFALDLDSVASAPWSSHSQRVQQPCQ